MGSDRVSECGQELRVLSPDHRFLIAMHSPDAVVKTGLPVRRPEKVIVRALNGVLDDTFSGPVREWKRAKLRRFHAISKVIQADFSAVQTAWRRGRHSNPRYRSLSCKTRRVRRSPTSKVESRSGERSSTSDAKASPAASDSFSSVPSVSRRHSAEPSTRPPGYALECPLRQRS